MPALLAVGALREKFGRWPNSYYVYKGDPLCRKYDLNEEFAARDGLVCSGTIFFFIDPIVSPGNFKHLHRKLYGRIVGNCL